MKMNRSLHHLAFLLFPLSFIACNSFYLGQNNTRYNQENIGLPFSQPSGQVIPGMPSGSECLNKFINDFMNLLNNNVVDLIKLNANGNDLVSQGKKVVRELYHRFSSGHKKIDCIWRKFSQSYASLYTEFGKKFFNMSASHQINPEFMPSFTYFASHIARNQDLKNHIQQSVDHAALGNNRILKNKSYNLIASIRRQIIFEMINQAYTNSMNQPSASCDFQLCKQILYKPRKLIDDIINLRFEYDKKYQEETVEMLKLMDKYGLSKSAVSPDKTLIYQCLEEDFNRLKSRYYDPIQKKGDKLFQAIENNIKPLSQNNLDLSPLKNCVDRLRHTIAVYNGIRLLLYCYLSHNSMMLPLTNPDDLSTDSAIRSCLAKIIKYTSLADQYILTINVDIQNSDATKPLFKLIESCADMAKLAAKTTP